MGPPQLLYVDAYDSFTNNIVALLKTSLGATVQIVKIDASHILDLEDRIQFARFLHQFDAVIVGPGPGNPKNREDVGWITRIWKLPNDFIIPVFGICLGFQSFCHEFGASIERLNEPRHGLVLEVTHNREDIFSTLDNFSATMYHSLHVSLGFQSSETDIWESSKNCPTLEPLAWDLQDHYNGPILLAAKHKSKPFWGVQFHPESIVTGARMLHGQMQFGDAGTRVIQGWWREVMQWRSKNTLSRKLNENYKSAPTIIPEANSSSLAAADVHFTFLKGYLHLNRSVHWQKIPAVGLTVQTISQDFDAGYSDKVVLESRMRHDGTPLRKDTGRYSIVGLMPETETVKLQYIIEPFPRILVETNEQQLSYQGTVSDFWDYLKRWVQHLKCDDGAPCIPFWGGFVGYISYEAGLATINVCGNNKDHDFVSSKSRPDITFVLVTRSVVVDHSTNEVYVQSIRAGDKKWVDETCKSLVQNVAMRRQSKNSRLIGDFGSPIVKACDIQPVDITRPSISKYMEKVMKCDMAIRNGDSYELCLTDQTQIHLPPGSATNCAWELYRRMTIQNPAPFAAYIRFTIASRTLNILSSSPERFLSWSRRGRCQFRPIKGTVKKQQGMTLQDAEAILKPSLNGKDVAENLMITDLIRHDLHGVVGTGNVHVTDLFAVEEYQTLFQLVSVIEGQLNAQANNEARCIHKDNHAHFNKQTGHRRSSTVKDGLATPESDSEPSPPISHNLPQSGIDILAASLPPGSMTGAPKKRSCEILQDIEEHKPRGIYSGVLGYLDVGGGADFSVVIRTAYRWSDDRDKDGNDVWTIGAGGAVTCQSTPGGEADEMMVKLESVLKAFGEVDSVK